MATQSRFRGTMQAVACALVLALSGAALSKAGESVQFDIASQPLSAALKSFAAQAKMQLLYRQDVVEGATGNAVVGNYDKRQALQHLIKGTGLEIVFSADNAATIRTKTDVSANRGDAAGEPQLMRLAQSETSSSAGSSASSASDEADSENSQNPNKENDSSTSSGAEENKLTEIVVTGSRIKREGADMPTPTVSLDADAIAATGSVKLQSILDELPAVAPGIQDNNSGNFSFALAGLNMVNLRDLDVRRTLVLVNGRRFTPTLTDADSNITAVDLNAIPMQMIERVDVITGGSGAVYGSDAVAGVVNLILKDKFEGFETRVQYGQSGHGDGDSKSVALTGGLNWMEGRGNSILHLSYSDNGRVKLEDRSFIRNRLDAIANPANTGPNDGIPDNLVHEGLNFAGAPASVVNFRVPPSAGQTRYAIDPISGNVRPFNGTPVNNARTRFSGGTDGLPVVNADLIVPVDRYLFAANSKFEIADGLTSFLDLNYARTRAQNRITPSFECEGCGRVRVDGVLTSTLDITHPFVVATPGLVALMQSAGTTSIEPDRSNRELGARGSDIERNLWQAVAGLRGSFGQSGWDWEGSYQFGESRVAATSLNDLIEDNFYQAVINVEADPAGGLRCADPQARAQGCVPFNILSNALQPAAAGYITADHKSRSRLRQNVVNAFVTGDAFKLPAGPVGMAAGVEYRRENVNIDQSDIYNSGSGFFNTQLPDLSGKVDSREVFAEARVPLLKDLPAVDSLSVQLATRLADYNTAGNATSWNVNLDWGIVRDLRFRGSVARAVRAPKVGELFTPSTNSAATVLDPCTDTQITVNPNRAVNCAALGVPVGFVAPDVSSGVTLAGNRSLEVEVGDTYTLGFVVTPRWAEPLTFTVDYWHVKIEDAITLFPFNDVLANCVDAPSINNSFCAQQTRLPNGAVDRVSSTFINASVFETAGIDFEATYDWDLARYGALRFRTTATYLDRRDFIVNPDAANEAALADPKAGEHGTPRVRGTFGTRYGIGGFNINADLRYVGATVANVRATPESLEAIEASERFYLDTQGRYVLGNGLEFYAGVDNVFNKAPPRNPSVFSGTGRLDTPSQIGAAIYDVYGRFFYLGTTARF